MPYFCSAPSIRMPPRLWTSANPDKIRRWSSEGHNINFHHHHHHHHQFSRPRTSFAVTKYRAWGQTSTFKPTVGPLALPRPIFADHTCAETFPWKKRKRDNSFAKSKTEFVCLYYETRVMPRNNLIDSVSQDRVCTVRKKPRPQKISKTMELRWEVRASPGCRHTSRRQQRGDPVGQGGRL